MFRLFLLISIVFLLSNKVYAQTDTSYNLQQLVHLTDSLKKARNADQLLYYAKIGADKAARELGKQDTTYAKMIYALGVGHYINKNYAEAESLFTKAIGIQELKNPVNPNHAQSLSTLGLLYQNTGRYEQAMPFLKKTIEINKQVLDKTNPTYAGSFLNLGLLYYYMGRLDESEALCLEALAILEQASLTLHPFYQNGLDYLGGNYSQMGRYEAAEAIMLKTLDITKRQYGNKHIAYSYKLMSLGILYMKMERYEQAAPLFLEAKEIQKQLVDSKDPSYAGALINLGILYWKMKQYKKAEPLYIEAIKVLEQQSLTEHSFYLNGLNNLGNLYAEMKIFDKAISLHSQVLNIRKKSLGEKHPAYASSLKNLGVLYVDMGDYEKAKKILPQALRLRREILGTRHPDCIGTLNNLVGLYVQTKEYDQALSYAQEAIYANCNLHLRIDTVLLHLDSFAHAEYVSISQMEESISYIYDLLSIIPTNQKQAQQVLLSDLVLRLLAQNKNSFEGEEDQLRVLSMSNKWVLRSLKVLDKQHQVSTAFSIAEQNKSVLLMDAIKTSQALDFGLLPDSLVRLDKSLKKEYSKVKATLMERQSESEKDSLRRVLNALNIEINQFRNLIEKDYPKYANLKNQSVNLTTTAIQALLDDKTALLEYVLGDSIIYIFYLDKKSARLFEHPMQEATLKQHIKKLHASLSDYEMLRKEPEKMREIYVSTAFWCYKHLLKEVLADAKDIDQLIIIPDGELAHLPFEAFLVENPTENQSYQDFHYLLADYKISYNYSATLWKDNIETKRTKNNGQFFAMAANYTGEVDSLRAALRLPTYNQLRQVLQALPAAQEEVEALRKKFKGFFGFGNLASEKIFKEKAGDYAIIHLAMHGLLDNKNPILSSLAFTEDGDSMENNFLQAYEISKMQLNADLVVLSACETGYGKFEKGNGTASLARAFMYAGVPAMVVSLWQVNDASTSLIMQSFYKNLATGMDKATALQQAKLTYVKTLHAASPQYALHAHPAFWAPFVQLGDSRPIAVETLHATSLQRWVWWIGGIATTLILSGGIYYILRRRRKQS